MKRNKTDKVDKLKFDPYYVDNLMAFYHDNDGYCPTVEEVDEFMKLMNDKGHETSEGMARLFLEASYTARLQEKYRELYNPGKQFMYAVGRPWKVDEPEGSVGFYAHGTTTFYGTLREAEGLCGSLNKKNDAPENPYRIYKITELTESDKDNLRP